MGSNWPELLFVIVVSSVFASIALSCLICISAFILTCVSEYKKWKRDDKIHKARMEMIAREQAAAAKKIHFLSGERRWSDLINDIDKEYRGN